THDAAPEWQKDLDSTCTTDVLLPPRAPLAQVLALDKSQWRLVQQDKLSVLYTRAQPLPGCPAA
ncbi:MAG TPA: hypothetical protein VKV69_12495, partial [Actinomycetota bacterium]|nr:hypothetical protein [Actinomycetota bacterium]